MKPAHEKHMLHCCHTIFPTTFKVAKRELVFLPRDKNTTLIWSANAKYTIVWQIQSYHIIGFQCESRQKSHRFDVKSKQKRFTHY